MTALGDTYRSNRFDQVCGCGQRVSECGFWQYVKERTGADRHPNGRVMLQQYPGDRGRRIGRLLHSDFTSFWASPANLRRIHGRRTLAPFREDYEAFLRAIHNRTPTATVFVDGLKFNSRVAALQAAEFPIDGVIHLYRDPVDFVGSSLRNTNRRGLIGVAEHALRYRLYHTRARQVQASLPGIDLSYEALAQDADRDLKRLFRFVGVAPMTVAELRQHFDREWHFMGNASLLKFNGQVRASKHRLPQAQLDVIRILARGDSSRRGAGF